MIEVLVADFSGFCFGVQRAIDVVLKNAGEKENVATFGPIIHNPQVVETLKKQGVAVINSTGEASCDMNIIIRSHGVEKGVREQLNKKTSNVIDATCPFVLKAQEQVREFSGICSSVVVLGEKEHPEVKGIISYAEGECFVIGSASEAEDLPYRKSYGFLAQTTQNKEIFQKISAILRDKCDELKVANTICSATDRRQKASAVLAEQVEVMVVVGGKNSANTTRLYRLCKEICGRTYHIETPEELDKTIFRGVSKVGITAGASTPKDFVCKVREYILEVSR